MGGLVWWGGWWRVEEGEGACGGCGSVCGCGCRSGDQGSGCVCGVCVDVYWVESMREPDSRIDAGLPRFSRYYRSLLLDDIPTGVRIVR